MRRIDRIVRTIKTLFRHSKYYDACSLIVESTCKILKKYRAEYERGLFMGEHPEMGKVSELIDWADELARDDYYDVEGMVEWLHAVAELLPQLWD